MKHSNSLGCAVPLKQNGVKELKLADFQHKLRKLHTVHALLLHSTRSPD